MLFFIAFVGAAVIALVLWKAMSATRDDAPYMPGGGASRPARPRVSGPDDDPEFLRQLDERTRRGEDPPPA